MARLLRFKGFGTPHTSRKNRRGKRFLRKNGGAEVGAWTTSQQETGVEVIGELRSRPGDSTSDHTDSENQARSPQKTNSPPPHIRESHWQEWRNSTVDEELIALNVRSLSGNRGYDALLYSGEIPRRNGGRLTDYWLKKYRHTELGGWWTSGLDPLADWQPMEWGRLKPNTPRFNWDEEQRCHTQKPVKYESPPKTPNRVTYLRIPLHVWQLVADRCNLPIPSEIVVSSEGEAVGFWAWVQSRSEVPIVLVEGEKKAACLLSLGFAAIALPGIWGGRVGDEVAERLHPDLMPMATGGRNFTILFDHETKPDTKRQVSQATRRTGQTIIRQGCLCDVAQLPGPEKGIDDWAIAQGQNANKAVAALIDDAFDFNDYQRSWFANRQRGLRKYKPNVVVNARYLSNAVKLPESGLVCLRSDMGSGKTKLLEDWRREHPDERFLNVGHRVNLLRNLAKRLKTPMYSALNTGDLGRSDTLSITIDSLHKLAGNLQAYGCLFLDEACQSLTHTLQSKTCKEHRGEILEVLEYLVYNSRLVVLADAHLDDVTIDFFKRCDRRESSPSSSKIIGSQEDARFTGMRAATVALSWQRFTRLWCKVRK